MPGLTDAVSGGQLLIAVPIALLAGVVSFASPCVLPLVPGYLSYIGGFADGGTRAARTVRTGYGPRTDNGLTVGGAVRVSVAIKAARSRMALGVVLFVFGFAVVFVATTYVVTSAGFWLLRWDDLVTRIAGAIVVLLGLVFVGRIRGAQRTMKPVWRPTTGLAGAPLLGAVFAIGWSPCIGPTLGAISAMSWRSPTQAAVLAFVYALGIGIPFFLIALGVNWTVGAVAFLKRHVRTINLVGGVLLVLLGLIMVSGLWGLWINDLKGVIPIFAPYL